MKGGLNWEGFLDDEDEPSFTYHSEIDFAEATPKKVKTLDQENLDDLEDDDEDDDLVEQTNKH
jgi:hypothetical protein